MSPTPRVGRYKITFNNAYQSKPSAPRRGGGKRKEIVGMSDSARLRFQRKLAVVNYTGFKGVVLFVTLTYPGDRWSDDPKDWKRDLQKFKQRFERKYGKTPGFWRLEVQKENAPGINPHFHLLLFLDTPRLSKTALSTLRAFVANSWYASSGKICDDHLLAGTQVKRVSSRKGWERVSKYVTKKEQLLEFVKKIFKRTGKVWGVWCEEDLPVQWETVRVPRKEAYKIRRWYRRLAGKKRGTGPIFRQHVFIRDTNVKNMLTWMSRYRDDRENGEQRIRDPRRLTPYGGKPGEGQRTCPEPPLEAFLDPANERVLAHR